MKRTMFAALVLAFATVAGTALAGIGWTQDFDTDADGWFDTDDYAGYGSIEAIDGHGVVNGTESGPFSRFGGYTDTWPGAWVADLDVYLDPAWELGTGFDYSVAANGSDGNHQRDFIFHVTKDTSTGDLMVGGSNNTNFAPREDLETINHVVVDEAGWYTLRHVFREDAGVLAVDLQLVDGDGSVLFTETRTSSQDTMSELGGNRYAWFTFVTVEDLQVDDHELRLAAPTSKQDCKDGGWEAFGFKNQGRCVASIASGK